jgi:hypothetical protein
MNDDAGAPKVLLRSVAPCGVFRTENYRLQRSVLGTKRVQRHDTIAVFSFGGDEGDQQGFARHLAVDFNRGISANGIRKFSELFPDRRTFHAAGVLTAGDGAALPRRFIFDRQLEAIAGIEHGGLLTVDIEGSIVVAKSCGQTAHDAIFET